jgi:hypothetical protein
MALLHMKTLAPPRNTTANVPEDASLVCRKYDTCGLGSFSLRCVFAGPNMEGAALSNRLLLTHARFTRHGCLFWKH